MAADRDDDDNNDDSNDNDDDDDTNVNDDSFSPLVQTRPATPQQRKEDGNAVEDAITAVSLTSSSLSSSSCSPLLSQSNMTRRTHSVVRFSVVNIREYALTLGDHPMCERFSMSLDWSHTPVRQVPLHEYERRSHRRPPTQQQERRRRRHGKDNTDHDDNDDYEYHQEFHHHRRRMRSRGHRRWRSSPLPLTAPERRQRLVDVTGIPLHLLIVQEEQVRLRRWRQEQEQGAITASPSAPLAAAALPPERENHNNDDEEEDDDDDNHRMFHSNLLLDDDNENDPTDDFNRLWNAEEENDNNDDADDDDNNNNDDDAVLVVHHQSHSPLTQDDCVTSAIATGASGRREWFPNIRVQELDEYNHTDHDCQAADVNLPDDCRHDTSRVACSRSHRLCAARKLVPATGIDFWE